MIYVSDIKKTKRSMFNLAALLGGSLISFSSYATTYNIGALSTTPYINTATVTGLFTDYYNFSVVGPSTTAGSAVTLNLDLGDFGFHISNLELDLYNASNTWIEGDMVVNSNDTAVSVTETLVAGNYYFRVRGTGDGDSTGKGIYGFSAVAAPVPEIDTYAMMLAGLGLVGFAVNKRHRIS